MKMKEEIKEYLKDLLSLALPVGLQMMINSAVTLIDNVMVGTLGDDGISAVTICYNYSWIFSTLSTAFASGALIMISRLWAADDKKEVKKIMSFALTINLAIASLMCFISALFPDQIMRAYSNIDSIVEAGKVYLAIVRYSYLFDALSMSIMILLRSVRKVRISLYSSLAACAVNTSLNYLLIGGNLGFPALGIRGAAIASLSARTVQLLIALVYLFFIDRDLSFRIRDFDPFIGKERFVSLVRLTMPILVIDFLASITSTVQTMITGHISKHYISANSIVHNSWELPNVFCWGVMSAANVMIGNIIGTKDYEKAYRFSRYFIITAIIIGSTTSVLLHVILELILPFYNVEEATIILARQMSYSASIIVIFSSFYTVAGEGVLKAGGNTKNLLKLDLLCSWLFALPVGAICAFVFRFPAYVLYVILRFNNILKTFWTIRKLNNRDWIVNL